MPDIRRPLVLAAALLLLVLGAAAYVAATFDANAYKAQIERYIKARTGYTLELEGPVAMSLWPSIGIDAGRSSLSDTDHREVLARMKRAHASIRILPLFSRRIVIDEIAVTGLQVTIVRYANGRTNIDGLLRSQERQPYALDIGGLRLRDSAVDVRDDAAKRGISLSELDVTINRIARGAPMRIELSGTARSAAPSLDASIVLKTVAEYDAAAQDWSLQELTYRMHGNMAGIPNAAVEATGRIAVNARTYDVRADGLRIVTKATWDARTLDLKLELPALQVSEEHWSAERMTLQALLETPRGRTQIALDAPRCTGNGAHWKSEAVTLAILHRGEDANFEAQTAAALSGNLQSRRIDITNLKTRFAFDAAAVAMKHIAGELSGNAAFDLAQQRAHLKLAGSVAESKFAARVVMAPLVPPTIMCDIDVDRLDLDRYLPAASRAPARVQPLDLSMLEPLRMSGTVRVGRLTLSQVTMRNARLVLARD